MFHGHHVLALLTVSACATPVLSALTECHEASLDSGAEELDDSSVLQEVLLLQVGHALGSGPPLLSPIASKGQSGPARAPADEKHAVAPAESQHSEPVSTVQETKVSTVAADVTGKQNLSEHTSAEVLQEWPGRNHSVPERKHSTPTATGLDNPQRKRSSTQDNASPLHNATSELQASHPLNPAEQPSVWERLQVILSNPVKDLWDDTAGSLSETDAKVGGAQQHEQGLGAWVLLIAAMSLWTFLLIECCKGGIHWGNTDQFVEHTAAAEQHMKPKVPVTAGQKDVASVARRAKEINNQNNQRGCC